MGILYFGDDLCRPSVLWMRRMLDGLGNEVTALVTEHDPGPKYRARFKTIVLVDDASLNIQRLLRRLGIIQSVWRTPRSVRPFLTALESSQVSAALVHYLTSAVLYRRVWRHSRKPVYVHCHGWDVTWDLRDHAPPGRQVHASDYVRLVRALPDHVHFIANSQRTAGRLRDVGIDDARIHLKYLGVPVSPLPPRRRTPSDQVTILYLGTLVDFKGPEAVIRAFAAASKCGLRGRLLMAGDGPLRSACERARLDSGCADRIELLGAVDEDAGVRLRSEADIFAAHNRTGPVSGQEEAFGVSIVEAMASGIPVVTGNSGAVPEVVRDGIEGILVEPGDIEAHASAFLQLGRDAELRNKMGRAGWERARRCFTIEREISTLRSILRLDR